MNLKQFLPQFNGQVILFGAVLLLVGMFAGNCSDPLGQYNKRFKAYQDTVVAPIMAQRDSIIVVNKAREDSMARLAQEKIAADRRIAARDAENARLRQVGEEWRQRYTTARQAFNQSLDSIPVGCEVVAAQATTALNAADSVIANKDTIIVNRDRTILETQQKVTIAEAATEQQRAIAASNLGRAERAEAALLNIPKPPSGKILGFIPMPSRTTTFVVGFIAGVVTIIAVD